MKPIGKSTFPGDSAGFSDRTSLQQASDNTPPACVAGGFSLIETLVVILVIGIICATGVSIYAGATTDSRILTINDSIQSFFAACRHRVKLRNTPVTVRVSDGIISTEQSAALTLRIPGLTPASAENLDGLQIEADGFRLPNGQKSKSIDIKIILPGNRTDSLRVEF